MGILDYIERVKRENEGPRITAQEPRIGLAGGQLVQPNVDGSRPGYAKRVPETGFFDTLGRTKAIPPWMDAVASKIIDYNTDKDAKVFISRTERPAGQTFRSPAVKGFLDQNQAIKFANATAEQIAYLSEKTGVSETIIKNAQKKYNAISASERRNLSMTKNQLAWQLKRVDLQKKILERVNQGDTSIKQIAKNLKMPVSKVETGAEKIYTNIFHEKLKINKGLNSTTVYLPKTIDKLNTLYEKLWKVDGFGPAEGRTWFKLTRDARESGRITVDQFKTANKNIRNFYHMKAEIQAKYPKIILNLDHPLSFGALKGMGATGEKFLTGIPTTHQFNQGIKQRLDVKYASIVDDVRQGVPGATKTKIAIEKLAKNLKIDIGEISPSGKKIVSPGKRNIVFGDEKKLGKDIIQSLKEQNILAKKIKDIDPKLLKAADMEKYFKKTKLSEISKKDLKGVAKILSDNGFKCKLGNGLTCNDPRAYINSINEQKALMQAGDKTAAKLFARTGNAMLKIGSKAARVAFSPALLWGEPFLEGAFIANDMLGNKTPWKEAVSKSYLTIPLRAMGLMKSSEEYRAADMIEVRDDRKVIYVDGKEIKNPNFGKVTGIREGVKRSIDAKNRLSELDRLQNKVSNLEQQKETNVDLYGTDVYHKMLTDAKKELSGYASAIQREGGEQKFMRDIKKNEKAYREREEVMLTKRMEGKKYKEDSPRVFYELDDPRFKEMEEYKMGREDVTGFMSRAEYEKFQESVPALKNVSYEDVPKFMEYTSMLKKRMPGSYPGQRIGQVYSTPASKYGWDLMGEVARAGGYANMASGGLANLTRTVAPDSGPMQGLASTPEYDTYRKEYKWQT